jgi:uncharacterized protein (TIGR02391 family)
MTNRQRAERIKEFIAVYDEDVGIIRNQDLNSQKWFSEILPLLSFKPEYQRNAQQSASILVQHGYSSSLYQKHESNFLLIARQAIGELSEGLDQMEKENQWNEENFWEDLHPTVVEQSRSRYESGHFADAVEASLKELNHQIKLKHKEERNEEKDGSSLMKSAFSPNNPSITLEDLSTDSGKNIQQGYMELFSGAMTGIRNPKAHQNISLDEQRCRHFLYFSSLLFHVYGERINP